MGILAYAISAAAAGLPGAAFSFRRRVENLDSCSLFGCLTLHPVIST